MYFKNIWIKSSLKKIKTTPQEAKQALEEYLEKEGRHNQHAFFKLFPQYSTYQSLIRVTFPVCPDTKQVLTKVEIIGEQEVNKMAKLAGIS